MLWVVLGCGRDAASLVLVWGWRSKVTQRSQEAVLHTSSSPPPHSRVTPFPGQVKQTLIHFLIVERDNVLDFKIIRLLVMRVCWLLCN